MLKFVVICFLLSVDVAFIYGDNIDQYDPEDLKPTLANFLNNPVDELKEVVREKCLKASGTNSTFEQLQKAGSELSDCWNRLPNYLVFQKEYEAEQASNDSSNKAVENYCGKHKELQECAKTFVSTLNHCLDEQEKKSRATIVDYYHYFYDFFCSNEGTNFKLYLAKKGNECTTEMNKPVQLCVVGPLQTKYDFYFNLFYSEAFDEKMCDEFDKTTACVVTEAKKCEEKTPANLLEAAFESMRNKSPCSEFTNKNQQN